MTSNEIVNTREIDLGLIRWIIYPKNGKPVVENHAHGRTWKTCYKDNYGNIDAVCFQNVQQSSKHFISPSPFGEYWQFEDMFVLAGGGTPFHSARSLCSKQSVSVEESESYWDVLTIDHRGQITTRTMTGSEIGYNSLSFINRNEEKYI
jgi:hypothetical protein